MKRGTTLVASCQAYLTAGVVPFPPEPGTLDMKRAALREHRSQMGDWDPRELLVEWAREQGARSGLEAAEAYRHMVLEGPSSARGASRVRHLDRGAGRPPPPCLTRPLPGSASHPPPT